MYVRLLFIFTNYYVSIYWKHSSTGSSGYQVYSIDSIRRQTERLTGCVDEFRTLLKSFITRRLPPDSPIDFGNFLLSNHFNKMQSSEDFSYFTTSRTMMWRSEHSVAFLFEVLMGRTEAPCAMYVLYRRSARFYIKYWSSKNGKHVFALQLHFRRLQASANRNGVPV